MNCNAFKREEEVRRFLYSYIEFKSPDGHESYDARRLLGVLPLSLCFACRPDLPVQEFHSYLANFKRQKLLAARVWLLNAKPDALKQVGLSQSPGLDSLLYEVYLRLSHMCLC